MPIVIDDLNDGSTIDSVENLHLTMISESTFRKVHLHGVLKYCDATARYDTAKEIAQWTDGRSSLRFSALKGTLAINQDRTKVEDSGAETRAKLFRFRVTPSGGGISHTTQVLVPNFLAANPWDTEQAGQQLATILNNASSGFEFELISV